MVSVVGVDAAHETPTAAKISRPKTANMCFKVVLHSTPFLIAPLTASLSDH
jgi:hypothetical protein